MNNERIISHSDLRDEELVRLVQAKDEAAFKELMSRYNPRIWNLVYENSRQHRDAEEILMDIWMVVWENIIGLRRAESFGGWLRRIAITACKRYYAKGQHQSEILLNYKDLALQIDRDALQRFQDDKILDEAREAVHHLPKKVQSVGILYYLEQWSINDIATELNLATGTVKTKLSQVRQLLRKEFGVTVVPIRRETMIDYSEITEESVTNIKVIGVGGAGCNAVKRMVENGFRGVEFCVVDTDRESLMTCNGATQVQIGINTTQGNGTDGNLKLGRQAAAENLDDLRSIVENTQMVFVITGLGGGTGTSVAPVIASLAREQNALTVCLATRPLLAEDQQRTDQAEIGMQEMHHGNYTRADAIIVIPNENVLDLMDKNAPLPEVFVESDEILIQGVKVISDMLSQTGEINVDIDDFKLFLQDQETLQMSIGKAKGENRATIAAQNAIASPLLDGSIIAESNKVIVNVAAPRNFSPYELNEAITTLIDDSAIEECIFGMVYKEEETQSDEIIITVIACMSGSSNMQDSILTPDKSSTSTEQGKVVSPTKAMEIENQPTYDEYNLAELLSNDSKFVRPVIENSVATTVSNQSQHDELQGRNKD